MTAPHGSGVRLGRRQLLLILLLLAVALGARLAWLAANRHLVLVNDPADYQRLAQSIASGHGFGTTHVAPGGGPTAFRPPLWPLFLGALYWVTGVHLTAARLVEVVLGTMTVGLIGVLARQLWSAPAAWVAMALAAVYPPLLLAGGSLLSESVSLPLELGSLSAALASRRSARPWFWVVVAGGLAGLDILARPDSFLLLVPIGLLLGQHWDGRSAAVGLPPRVGVRILPGGPRRMLPGAAAVLVAGLVVTPWLVRDARVMHRFVPLTTQGGLVASGTYNDTAAHDPRYPAAWRPTNLVPEYVPLLKGTEVQEEAALRRASLHYIALHPFYPFRVSGWNLLRLFDLTGISGARGSWGANGYGPDWADLDAYGLIGLSVLLGAGVVAALVGRRSAGTPGSRGEDLEPGPIAWRVGDRAPVRGAAHADRAGSVWPVWMAPVLIVIVTIPVLGESRLRVGVDPFLVLAAAWGVTRLIEVVRRRGLDRARPGVTAPA